ncbi:sigma 54-interacting transcriptional regulator [Leminorella grimontii]|uniref:sigma 54-interacting transcriptional regulator n=1 Tax=Leminorella grimontii TaxID=82981 RepID=UPI00322075FE
MGKNEIVIFSVSLRITQRISTLLAERKLQIPVYELNYFDVLDKANELIKNGTKIIISRGGTADLLRNNVSIPIVEISHNFYGIYRTLKEAREKSHKIAAVGFPRFCDMLKHYQSLTNEEFKICQVYNHADIENVIRQLSEENYRLVIGGLTVAEKAKKYGLGVVMGDTDNISIEQALNEAFSFLKYIREENEKLLISNAALNQTREGILCIDESGEIKRINAKGVDIFKCNAGENIFRKPHFEPIHNSIINEVELKDHPVEIHGETVFLNLRHVKNRQNFYTILSGNRSDSAFILNGKAGGKLSPKSFLVKYGFSDIVGSSKPLMHAVDLAKTYAKFDFPVHIYGETGTGKELFAQSIHGESARKNEPFIAINCAALPESILESELFGYVDGAFTSARKGGKVGIFELARNGTVFIDEISEAPLSVQIKLLRVLQEKSFTRLGGESLISTDFRLITASNKDLSPLVVSGAFREDLFYRINILNLNLPGLCERRDDVMAIIYALLAQSGRELSFTDAAIACLKEYAWPGNVRELQAVVYRLLVLAERDVVDREDLYRYGKMARSDASASASLAIDADATDLLRKNEQHLIREVMALTAGDRVKASAILGISPSTLWRKTKVLE